MEGRNGHVRDGSTDVPSYPYSYAADEEADEIAPSRGDLGVPGAARQSASAAAGNNVGRRRGRIDSLSSIGSSVAPPAIFRHAHGASGRRERAISPSMGDRAGRSGGALEAWLQDAAGTTATPTARAEKSRPKPDQQAYEQIPLGLSGADFGSGKSESGRSRRGEYKSRHTGDDGSVGAWSNGVRSGSGQRRLGKPRSSLFDAAQTLDLSLNAGSASRDRVSSAMPSPPLPGGAEVVDSIQARMTNIQKWRQQSSVTSTSTEDAAFAPDRGLRPAQSASSIASRSRNRKQQQLPSGSLALAGIHEVREGHTSGDYDQSIEEDSALRSFVRWASKNGLKEACLPIGILAVVLVKWITGLGSWSGKGMPPMFGDFEAQRHWMELTLHVQYQRWYFYGPEWWQLDYPPISAWASLICGKM